LLNKEIHQPGLDRSGELDSPHCKHEVHISNHVLKTSFKSRERLSRIQTTLLSTAAKADLHSRVWNISQAIRRAPR